MRRTLLLAAALLPLAAVSARAAFVDLGVVSRGDEIISTFDLTTSGQFEDQFRYTPDTTFRPGTRVFLSTLSSDPTDFTDERAEFSIFGGQSLLFFAGGSTITLRSEDLPPRIFYDFFLRYEVLAAPAEYRLNFRVTPLPAAGGLLAAALGVGALLGLVSPRSA
jgi:hypothetical protein